MNKRSLNLVSIAGSLLMTLVLSATWMQAALRSDTSPKDFYNTWSFTRAVVSDCSPYDLACRDNIIQTQSSEEPVQLEVVEPPNLFTFFFWSTKFSLGAALEIWRCASILLLLASLFLSRAMFQNNQVISKSTSTVFWTLLIFINFAPASLDIQLGQISALVSFGLVLFAVLIKSYGLNSVWAGLALSITLIKPNLLYLLYLYLTIETLRTKSFRLIGGGLLGAVVMFGVPCLYRPSIMLEFWQAISNYSTDMMRATIGTWLRIWLGPDFVLLDYLLMPLSIIALGTWCLRRESRFTGSHKAVLVYLPLLSIISTPYCLPYDFVVLIPAMMWFVSRSASIPASRRQLLCGSVVLLNQYTFMQFSEMHQYAAYPWVVLALCLLSDLTAGHTASQPKHSLPPRGTGGVVSNTA